MSEMPLDKYDSKHIKKIQKRRKRINKIRNNHIAGTVITLLLLVVLASTATIVFASSFMSESLLTSFDDDKATLVRIKELYYKNSADPEKTDIFGALDTKDRAHFILDRDGNMILQKGDNTCDISDGKYAQIVKRLDAMSNRSSKKDTDEDEISEDEDFDTDAEQILSSKANVECLPDKEGDYFKLSKSDELNDEFGISWDIVTALKKKYDLSLTQYIYSETKDDDTFTFPYWMGTRITEDGKMLFFRTNFVVTGKQIGLTYAMLVVMGAIMIFMITLMLINMISSLISKNMLANAYFTDMVTRGHNLNWFDLMCDKYLCSAKNSKVRCAVLNIAFANYRALSISHSPDESEKMLADVYKEISRFFDGKKGCCAHCTTSNFAAVTHAEEKSELDTKLQLLLTDLENISKEYHYCFHIGVAFAEPETNAAGRLVKREFSDVLGLYNNACTARETLDDTDESAIAYFDSKLIEEQQWINTVNEEQLQALQNEEFQVYYQPKYDPRTNMLRGAEALIRWQSPVHGFVTPNRMIPIFEKNGFITEIDHYMLTHVARDQKRWLDSGLKCVPVSVNVSRAHFIEEDLAEQIRDSVDKEGTPHELIEIELTESAFFDDKKAMISTITRLKEYGFTVSMDDFGAGYSSLNSLKDMPLDVLKLDAEFFRGSSDDGRGEIVVSEAIKLAKNLKMRTVAEGVEIKEQVDFLAGQGCDMIQGYYYSKPLPCNEFEQRMKTGISDVNEPAENKPADNTNNEKESAEIVASD